MGEMPPLGHVPARMHAWAIRRDRHGEPTTAMQLEVLPTPEIGERDVLVHVMAAGVNYNGVWAAMGAPLSPFDIHGQDVHVAGSDASGIIWAVGSKVKHWKVGDEVVVHCNQDDGDDADCNGGDPDAQPQPAHMGLRNARRRFRPVLPRPVSPAIAAPEAPGLGRERLLHANIGNSLPDDVRPRAASTRARPTCAGVGCGRRAWVICSPTGTDSRRQANRCNLRQ